MKNFLVLVDSVPYIKVRAKDSENALSYINSKYSFEGLNEYIVLMEVK